MCARVQAHTRADVPDVSVNHACVTLDNSPACAVILLLVPSTVFTCVCRCVGCECKSRMCDSTQQPCLCCHFLLEPSTHCNDLPVFGHGIHAQSTENKLPLVCTRSSSCEENRTQVRCFRFSYNIRAVDIHIRAEFVFGCCKEFLDIAQNGPDETKNHPVSTQKYL